MHKRPNKLHYVNFIEALYFLLTKVSFNMLAFQLDYLFSSFVELLNAINTQDPNQMHHVHHILFNLLNCRNPF